MNKFWLAFRLLATPIGRLRIGWGLIYRAWPILRLMADIYQRIALRGTRHVAVIGSFGKTTATRAAMAALGLPFERHTIWNAGGFVPLGILQLHPRAPFGVHEVGISGLGWMAQYARLIRPDVVIVTSIGSEHHRKLGTLEETREEKANMVRAVQPSGLVVLNGDDPNVLWMATQTSARVRTVGFEEHNDVRILDVRIEGWEGSRICVEIDGQVRNLATRLLGKHMVYPVLAAAIAAHELGVSFDSIAKRLARLTAAPERMEPIRTPNGALVLLDSKKGALETIDAGLDVLSSIEAVRRIVMLGDIEDPPSSQGPLYKSIGARLAGMADLVVFVGGRKAYRSVAGGAQAAGSEPSQLIYGGRRAADAVDALRLHVDQGDVILVKGRSTQHLGRIGLALAGRHVTCTATDCPPTPTCSNCPMLERRVRMRERLSVQS